jgi:hypothetical protein
VPTPEFRESQPESQLYPELETVLRDTWVEERAFGFDNVWIQTIAHQGKRDTGGKWSRPDIALIGLTNYQYLPGRYLEVMTFEVKTIGGIDVSAVYEALAHRRGATRSYVLLHVSDDPDIKKEIEPTLDVVREEANRHGIGVIEFSKASDFETWDTTVEAIRVDADPQKINDFIKKQFPETVRAALTKHLKS